MIMYRVIEMEYNKYSLQCSLFDKMLFISDTVRARIFPYCHYYSAKIRKYRRIDDGYSAITIIAHESFKRICLCIYNLSSEYWEVKPMNLMKVKVTNYIHSSSSSGRMLLFSLANIQPCLRACISALPIFHKIM